MYENAEPGSVISIWAQPAPSGADASPGGGAPSNQQVAGGVLTTTAVPQLPTTVDDQVLDNVDPTTANSTAQGASPSSSSINRNPAPFVQVWRRSPTVCLVSYI